MAKLQGSYPCAERLVGSNPTPENIKERENACVIACER